jgi:hypothetical protein
MDHDGGGAWLGFQPLDVDLLSRKHDLSTLGSSSWVSPSIANKQIYTHMILQSNMFDVFLGKKANLIKNLSLERNLIIPWNSRNIQ